MQIWIAVAVLAVFSGLRRKCNFLWWLPATRILHMHISKSIPVRVEMVAVDAVTCTEGHTCQKFSHGQFFSSASSSCFTMNYIMFCFLVHRGLGNYGNSKVSASQILMRPSQGVQKDPIFIFKISPILNKSLNIYRILEHPYY